MLLRARNLVSIEQGVLQSQIPTAQFKALCAACVEMLPVSINPCRDGSLLKSLEDRKKLLQILNELEALCAVTNQESNDKDGCRELQTITRLVQHMVNDEHHYRYEEKLLLPEFRHHGFGAFSKRLENQYEQLRIYLHEFQERTVMSKRLSFNLFKRGMKTIIGETDVILRLHILYEYIVLCKTFCVNDCTSTLPAKD